ncbi:GNAT family N-acetyltransferase [Dysgonomonas sp. Marseille-P4677]|uniref:GNAT family N-acetyltransferase n=1 Tax=Dysgonomonas sp. Marseille-P4677 TaxID=2364790 RepID=UPI00191308C2|nr:GNAT family N-acetyltransferase [Dysgonomonas sp. Marseille-P4677]MBK5720320.1 GNAT family N-acetyltransferase [Dysgonomonas sp. Marseille-P4677]
MIINEAPYQDVLNMRKQVMYPDKDIDFVKLPDDDRGLHIGVFENEVLVSVMSLFLEGRDVQFRKLATRNDMQGKGYASALMQWLIDYANDLKFDRLWCNARTEATSFYKKFGYEETNESFEKNGYKYIVMQRLF